MNGAIIVTPKMIKRYFPCACIFDLKARKYVTIDQVMNSKSIINAFISAITKSINDMCLDEDDVIDAMLDKMPKHWCYMTDHNNIEVYDQDRGRYVKINIHKALDAGWTFVNYRWTAPIKKNK